jgi:thiamine biosynthesis lipoprotein
LLAGACSDKKDAVYQEDRGEIFHTFYSIKYEYSRSLKTEILDELHRFDRSLNPFNPASIISRINNNDAIAPDSLFIEVFSKAQEVSAVSDGLFDITCSPLINAWGFGFKNMQDVTPLQIDSLKAFVGYEKISLKNGRIIKTDPRVQINTSAIAKGFSVDVVARLLDSFGVKNYLCEIGGEIRAKGLNRHNKCWRIGIDKPVDEKNAAHRQLQSIIRLCNKSIATSGNYRNFYLKDGKKYAHTINPQTGYPSEGNILSASVVADDCMTADAYATVFMLTSIDDMRRIAREQRLDVFLIYSDENGQIVATYTDGFEKYFK